MDQQVQNDLVEKSNIATQKIGIFAEEDGLRLPTSEGIRWVIDPIDGTNNFVTQKEDFWSWWPISKTESVGLA